MLYLDKIIGQSSLPKVYIGIGGIVLDNTVFLNTNREMPLLGLGVYKATGENEAENAIISAVESGYRLIDTASVYKNEENVGRGIASCGIPRNELFITTKVWNTAQRLGDIQGAFERSLDRLKLDYVDLYLIHWPVPGCYLSTWKVLEEIQKELIDYCQDKGIQVQAYAPLARGAYLDNDVMCVLGTKYAHTPAQIGLRWATQKGISVIPKSVHPDRIRSNGNIFDFTIEQEDMDLIDTLNENFHSSHVPEDLRDIAF